MKTILFAAAILLGSFVTAPKAHAFVPVAECSVTPGQASCAITNTFGRFIRCWGGVSARTASGGVLYVNPVLTIAPGTYQYVYVNAFLGDPIVGAWASFDCGIL